MTRHALGSDGNRRTLHHTKAVGRGVRKVGIPQDRVVYTELSRGLWGVGGGTEGRRARRLRGR